MKRSLPYSYHNQIGVIWIALCAGFTSFTLLRYFNFEYQTLYTLAVFFATLCIYEIPIYLKSKNKVLALIILSFILTSGLIFLYIIPWLKLILLGIVSFIAIFYVRPIEKINTRTIPFLKIFWISLVWSTLLFLPIITLNDNKIVFFSLSFFLFIYSITIPFDIRDQKKDENALKTLPQLVGSKSSIVISLLLFLISFLILLQVLPFSISVLFWFLITFILLFLNSSLKKIKWYYLLLDGTILLFGVNFLC